MLCAGVRLLLYVLYGMYVFVSYRGMRHAQGIGIGLLVCVSRRGLCQCALCGVLGRP